MTRITWIGHSTLLIETGGRRILTDPVLVDRIGPVGRRSAGVQVGLGSLDAVLISHMHHDHLHLPSLRQLGPDVVVVGPAGVGGVLGAKGFGDVQELVPGERTSVGDLTITAVPARHSGRRLPFGPAAPALGFMIEGEHRIYFAGDTDLYPEMVDLAPGIDLAILPVGGWGPTLRGGHLDPVRAAAALALLQPRAAMAVHWGTLWPIGLSSVRRRRFEEPGRHFVEEAHRVAPDVSVTLIDPGGHLVITASGSIEVPAPSEESG